MMAIPTSRLKSPIERLADTGYRLPALRAWRLACALLLRNSAGMDALLTDRAFVSPTHVMESLAEAFSEFANTDHTDIAVAVALAVRVNLQPHEMIAVALGEAVDASIVPKLQSVLTGRVIATSPKHADLLQSAITKLWLGTLMQIRNCDASSEFDCRLLELQANSKVSEKV